MTKNDSHSVDEDETHIGHLDAAEHYIYVVEHDERYRCPNCGTLPIDWEIFRESLESLTAEQIWTLVPDSPNDPSDVFVKIETAATELNIETNVTTEDLHPRCTVCGTMYQVSIGE